jgi:hypothetical protein
MLITERDHLLAIDLPAFIASYLADLPAADGAGLTPSRLTGYVCGHLARSSSIGYRPAAESVLDIFAIGASHPEEFNVARWPWTFGSAGPESIGTHPPINGPRRIQAAQLFPTAQPGGLINLGIVLPTETRGLGGTAPAPITPTDLSATLYRVIGGDLIALQTVTGQSNGEAFFQTPAFSPGEIVALTVKTHAEALGWSYPSALLSVTALS